MVFQLLDSVAPEVKLVETVGFKVDKGKEKRFLELVDSLIADSKSPAIVGFNLHKCLPASEHSIEYLLYEVWRDRDGGFAANIAQLHKKYPEVCLRTLEQWLYDEGWHKRARSVPTE
jgi:hypothetical protein